MLFIEDGVLIFFVNTAEIEKRDKVLRKQFGSTINWENIERETQQNYGKTDSGVRLFNFMPAFRFTSKDDAISCLHRIVNKFPWVKIEKAPPIAKILYFEKDPKATGFLAIDLTHIFA